MRLPWQIRRRPSSYAPLAVLRPAPAGPSAPPLIAMLLPPAHSRPRFYPPPLAGCVMNTNKRNCNAKQTTSTTTISRPPATSRRSLNPSQPPHCLPPSSSAPPPTHCRTPHCSAVPETSLPRLHSHAALPSRPRTGPARGPARSLATGRACRVLGGLCLCFVWAMQLLATCLRGRRRRL